MMGKTLNYAVNKGVRIHYEIVGDGPPLILQHGFTQSTKDWHRAGYVEALKPHYRLILVDARGHGKSDKPHDAAAYALSNRVNDILAVMDSLGVLRAIYWGYSMGGWIGFGMATEAQARLRAIIIGGQHPYGRKMPLGLPDGSDAKEFITSFLKRIGIDFDTLPGEDKEQLLASDCRALAADQQDRPSLEAFLRAMTVPCLLYAGEADGVFRQAQKSAMLIPKCTFVPLPGLDHGSTFYTAAEIILPHVLNFLRDAEG
jgi:pimeloyl-ACP methyl ester carboxylesterase